LSAGKFDRLRTQQVEPAAGRCEVLCHSPTMSRRPRSGTTKPARTGVARGRYDDRCNQPAAFIGISVVVSDIAGSGVAATLWQVVNATGWLEAWASAARSGRPRMRLGRRRQHAGVPAHAPHRQKLRPAAGLQGVRRQGELGCVWSACPRPAMVVSAATSKRYGDPKRLCRKGFRCHARPRGRSICSLHKTGVRYGLAASTAGHRTP
jgi:hypothetical protein